jgi:hypothetical protein
MEDIIYVIVVVIIILVVVAVVVALVSYALGVWFSYEIPKTDPAPPGGSPPAEKPCTQCDRDKAWYDAQPGWKQAAITVWWVADRSACAAKGCS